MKLILILLISGGIGVSGSDGMGRRSPTPTATPVFTPTATATATATATYTPTPAPTATATATSTPTPAPSPTAAPTATPAPSPTPTATAIPPTTHPYGIFELDSGLTNNAMTGVSFRNVGSTHWVWSQIEPQQGVIEHAQLDTWSAQAKAAHKFCAYTYEFAIPPQWLIDLGVQTYQYTGGYNGQTKTVALPYDVADYIIADIVKSAPFVDGNFDYVVMGGFGIQNESYWMKPADVGETNETETAKMVASSTRIFDAWGQNFHKSRLIFAFGCPPVPGYQPSCDALDTVARAAMAKYPNMGAACFGLSSTSNISYAPNKLVSDMTAAGHFAMFQIITNLPAGTEQATIDKALSLGGQAIEWYSGAANNAANAPMFIAANASMKTLSGDGASKAAVKAPAKKKPTIRHKK